MINTAVIRVAQETTRVDASWLRLIRFAQDHPYCTIKLTIREGEPYMAEEAIETHKFS